MSELTGKRTLRLTEKGLHAIGYVPVAWVPLVNFPPRTEITMKLDDRRRTPSEFRNLLEVRVRKLSRTKPAPDRMEALCEIRDIADVAIAQMQTEDPSLSST